MADLDSLTAAYDAQVAEVRQRVSDFGTGLWRSLPNYRDRSIDRMVGALVPRVQAGQIQIAQLTDAYLSVYAAQLGIRFKTSTISADLVTGSRGVEPSVVYRRPANTVYSALADGKSVAQAVDSGELRLLQLIGGDMQMARRSQAHTSFAGSGFAAYRRTLSGSENCALCTVASTQRYWVKDLLPIHPGCDCGIEPLPEGDWSGQENQVINSELLEQTHSAISNHLGVSDRGGRLPDYRKLQIMQSDDGSVSVSGVGEIVTVRTHGEYGPTLTWSDQDFTGPRGLS